MLEGLDAVDWAALSHAYGPAEDVPGLIRALLSDDEEARERALQELFSTIWHQGTVYEATAPAVPFLLELLAAPGVAVKQALFYLLSCIADGHSYVEVHAPLLDRMGVDWPDGEEGREEQIGRERDWVRAAREAVEAGAGVYLDLLADPDPEVRDGAVAMLGLCASRAGSLIPELAARIPAQEDPKGRAALLLSLGDLATAAGESERVAPLFAGRMGPEEPPVVRLAAAVGLARATPGGPSPAVLDAIGETAPMAWGDFEAVGNAAAGRIFEAIGDDPVMRWRILSAALDGADPSARSGARHAAERMAHERRSMGPIVAAALAERLPAADPEERRGLVLALAHLGKAAAAAAGPLAAALGDDDAQVRTWAAVALADLGDPRAIPVIIERAQVERALIARTLDAFGPEAGAVVPALIDVLRRPPAEKEIGNPRIRAALALGRIGPDARPAIPALIALMEREPEAQPVAAEAIGRIGGPEARAAIPALKRLLRSPDERCRIRAAQALWQIDGQAGPALDVLGPALRSRGPGRSLAAQAIGEMGEAARGEAEALADGLDDRSPHARWIRLESAIALWRVTRQADRSLSVLLALFRDPDVGATLATRAAEGLGEMGAEAREAIPILREAAAADVRPFGHLFAYSSHFVIEDDALLAAIVEAIRRIEGDPEG